MRFSSHVLALIPASILALAGSSHATAPLDPQTGFGRLPLLFEANGGHYDPEVAFLSRAPGYRLFLTPDAMTLALLSVDPDAGGEGQPGPAFVAAVRTRFVGAAPAPAIEGLDEAETRIHYLIGNDPDAWSVDNPTFSRVRYRDLWEGVDLLLYDQAGELEYDFVVAPGKDPSVIRMAYEGVDGLTILPTGQLRLRTPVGDLVHSAPVIHQPGAHGPEPVSGRFVLRSPHEVGFELDAYDTGRPLVIDPVLVYSTLFGGGHTDVLHDVAVGSSGTAVITGVSTSTDLPVTAGALDGLYNDQEAFVARLSSDGTALEWCTYLGGSTPIPFAWDYGHAVELDEAEQVYVVGHTSSDNFPVTFDALKLANGSDWFAEDGFLSVLSADGSSLVYSTLIGGDFQDYAYDVAVDPSGQVSVVGRAFTSLAVTPNAFQPTKASSGSDAFLYVFTPGSPLTYGTYLGGMGEDQAHAVRAGADGRIYMAGWTESTSFPVTASAFQGAKAAGKDAFVARLDPVSGALEYATYLGGDNGEMSFTPPGLAADGAGRVWLVGGTHSTDYPTTPGALLEDDINPGFSTGLLTCLDTDQSGAASMVFSTLFGGTAVDALTDVELDSGGTCWVMGWSHSDNLPLLDPWDDERDSVDLVLASFDPAGTLLSSTFFGGTGPEPHGSVGHVGGLAIDKQDHLYLASTTITVADRLTTPGALQTTLTGGADCVVARFTPLTASCAPDLGFQGQGDVTLSLCGDPQVTPGTFSRLEIEGALPGSVIYLVASTQSNPTWLPKIDATLVPLPIESLTILVQGSGSDIELFVPGIPGPFTVFLQAVAAGQGGPFPWHTSNAIQIDAP